MNAKPKVKRWAIVVVCTLVLVILLTIVFHRRIGLLSCYYQLVTDPDLRERLDFTPAEEKWSVSEEKETLSLGYAKFGWPFGEIESISVYDPSVLICSESVDLLISSRACYDGVDYEESQEDRDKVGYEQRMVPRRGQLVFVPWERSDIEKRLEAQGFYDPYSDYRQMMNTVPMPFIDVLFMGADDLFTYVYMLEHKCYKYRGGPAMLFEREDIRGFINPRQLRGTKRSLSGGFPVGPSADFLHR